MITSDISELGEFCRRDVFGTRISALSAAYREMSDGAVFMLQKCGDSVTAAISSVCSSVTLSCSEDADYEEISAYLGFLGFSNLQCSVDVADRLGRIPKKRGSVVEYQGNGASRTAQGAHSGDEELLTQNDCDFDYREVYGILLQCDFLLGDFSQWLADISLRVRRDTAGVKLLRCGAASAATASALFITDTAVLLGAVGTLESFRSRGYAGRLVLSLASDFFSQGLRTELLCEEHRLSFYESFGFKKTGEWTQIYNESL